MRVLQCNSQWCLQKLYPCVDNADRVYQTIADVIDIFQVRLTLKPRLMCTQKLKLKNDI